MRGLNRAGPTSPFFRWNGKINRTFGHAATAGNTVGYL